MNQMKIQSNHKSRLAYVYLRQSTMGQVYHHRESTERQYNLKNKAADLGWTQENIHVLDGDLGKSGKSTEGRQEFKKMVAEVSLNKVGAIFALEASRLSRSSADWNRLFELCLFTHTLIIDEDGCYDPTDFNDQLILGLKGIMSQAELHFIRVRLQGGKIHKAKKGELRFPLPVGLCYNDEGQTIIDPDIEVQHALRSVFKAFKDTGSAYGVTHFFSKNNMQFPKRAYGGIWKGKLIWGYLTHSRATNILKNPSYAGAYVYGRYGSERSISPNGDIKTKTVCRPQSEWQVCIQNHHEGYITWNDYLHNVKILKENCVSESITPRSVREGKALLQGLLICGKCGRRITIRYTGNGGIYPTYQCNWRKREGLASSYCISFSCKVVDEAISEKILEILQQTKLQLAVKSFEELEKRNNSLNTSWKLKIERAEYEAQLAQRRYEEVDPANRHVAGTLETKWNEKLIALEEINKQYKEYKTKHSILLTPELKKQIIALAQDIPRLWKASTTEPKDRKRIIRLLIKDITVEKKPEKAKKLILHIRWQGGLCEDLVLDLPQNYPDKLRYPKSIVKKIRLLAKKKNDSEIAEVLNQEGLRSSKGNGFTKSVVSWIRYKHGIPSCPSKNPGEFTVKEVSEKYGLKIGTIYELIKKEKITARKIKKGYPYFIALDIKTKKVLAEITRKRSER
jgi:DNA invertase Pin-like site-specific DNA recombinase